jgi:hypothetical protein
MDENIYYLNAKVDRMSDVVHFCPHEELELNSHFKEDSLKLSKNESLFEKRFQINSPAKCSFLKKFDFED